MSNNKRSEKKYFQSPIKTYRVLDNFNLENFYDSQYPAAKEIVTYRDDIDLPKVNTEYFSSMKSHTKRIIREYAPWENMVGYTDTEMDILKEDNDISVDTELKSLEGYSPSSKEKKGIIGAIVLTITVLVLKLKVVILLFLGKVLPLLGHLLSLIVNLKGILITAGSMIVTILAYAAIYKFELAVGLVFLIFVHEMGHALILTIRGVSAGLPIFIPFFGAFITLKSLPKDAFVEAQVAIGGPFLGTTAALAMYCFYMFTHQQVWLYLAYIGFFMNLFNLMPIKPLDGGRIVGAISTKIWILGFILLLVTFIFVQSPVLIVILFFAFIELINNYQQRKEFKEKYFDVPPLMKGAVALSYFLLVIFLAFALYETHSMLNKG